MRQRDGGCYLKDAYMRGELYRVIISLIGQGVLRQHINIDDLLVFVLNMMYHKIPRHARPVLYLANFVANWTAGTHSVVSG